MRVPRRAAVVLSAAALSGVLVGCSEEAVAPEQGVDAGEPEVTPGPGTGETGSGEGASVGVDGTTAEETEE